MHNFNNRERVEHFDNYFFMIVSVHNDKIRLANSQKCYLTIMEISLCHLSLMYIRHKLSSQIHEIFI